MTSISQTILSETDRSVDYLMTQNRVLKVKVDVLENNLKKATTERKRLEKEKSILQSYIENFHQLLKIKDTKINTLNDALVILKKNSDVVDDLMDNWCSSSGSLSLDCHEPFVLSNYTLSSDEEVSILVTQYENILTKKYQVFCDSFSSELNFSDFVISCRENFGRTFRGISTKNFLEDILEVFLKTRDLNFEGETFDDLLFHFKDYFINSKRLPKRKLEGHISVFHSKAEIKARAVLHEVLNVNLSYIMSALKTHSSNTFYRNDCSIAELFIAKLKETYFISFLLDNYSYESENMGFTKSLNDWLLETVGDQISKEDKINKLDKTGETSDFGFIGNQMGGLDENQYSEREIYFTYALQDLLRIKENYSMKFST